MKKYKVTLTAEERQSLQSLICAGNAAALRLARILLKADDSPGAPACATYSTSAAASRGGNGVPPSLSASAELQREPR